MRTSDTAPRPWWPIAVFFGVGAAAGTTAPRLLPPSTAVETSRAAASADDGHAPEALAVDGSTKLRPVLHLIGESLGVGRDTQRADAARSAALLLRYVAAQSQPDARAAVLEALRTRLEEPTAAAAGAPNDRLQALEVLSQPMAGLPDGSEVSTARKQLLEFLRSEASDERLLQRLHQKAEDAGVTVDFIVAGVADYVDSNVGWYADLQLEAIQTAMTATGYTFDRSYLPDWPRHTHDAHVHRESPGAIVFRARSALAARLRVVLLVPETPTAGLHREALRNALTLARVWPGDPEGELRILGPNFSGSVSSLARVLREDPAIWNVRRVRIISGSTATLDSKEALEKDAIEVGGRRMVEFSATTHPFPDWLRALGRFLRSISPSGGMQQLAILHESNTTFGASARAVASQEIAREGPVRVTPIAFPLHVSRLRDMATTASPGAVRPGQMRAAIPLTRREPSTPTDQLPPVAPDLTAASVEATMASVFDALRRERFPVVAIIATDHRDTLYLAREVRRISPDTQLVFFGSYMLMFHPEYAAYTRGALVVSSYPLAEAAAHWGVRGHESTPRHFPAWFAEGIYNAALALVGDRRLSNYAVRAADGSRPSTRYGPPVWLSVIGRTGFVPLAAYPPQSNGFLHLEAAIPAAPNRHAPPLPTLLLVLACLVAFVWHVSVVGRQVAFILGHREMRRTAVDVTCRKAWWHVRRWSDAADRAAVDSRYNRHDVDRDRWVAELQEQRVAGFRRVFVLPWRPLDARRIALLFVHAAFGLFGLVLAWWVLLGIRLLGSASYAWPIAVGVAAAAVPVLLALTEHSSRLKDRKAPGGDAEAPRPQSQGRAFAAIVSLAILVGVPGLAYVLDRASAGDSFAYATMMEADRGLSILTLVSPTVPIVCFALCAYTWLLWQLRVLSFVGNGYVKLFAAVEPAPAAVPERKEEAMAAGVGLPIPTASGGTAADGPQSRSLDADRGKADGEITAALEPAPPVPAEAAVRPADRPAPKAPRAEPTMTSVLLSGTLGPTADADDAALQRWRDGFVGAFDLTLPTWQSKKLLLVTLLIIVPVAVIVCSRVYTLEGPRFTGVFRAATLGGLALAVLAMLQTYAQWRQVGGILARLGRSPLAPAFNKVRAFHLDWRLNLRLPRRDELALLMAETDTLEALLPNAAQQPADVPLTSERAMRERVCRQLLISASLKPDTASLAEALEKEQRTDHLRLLNTDAFGLVWARTRRYLPLLQKLFEKQGQVPDAAPHGEQTLGPTGLDWAATEWFERAQGAVALAQAFVLRDLLSRIVAGLSASCLCFVLLLAAHLLYSFPGRSTLLVIDWIAVGASGAMAVAILVGMEKSVVLSHLWDSVPGRVSFNRDFVQRLSLYGALPALTVVSALFPEMGDTIFSWLAPARQLAGF